MSQDRRVPLCWRHLERDEETALQRHQGHMIGRNDPTAVSALLNLQLQSCVHPRSFHNVHPCAFKEFVPTQTTASRGQCVAKVIQL
ncbi:hypothetical protein Y1Q_0011278 [Alligator mississippiensis]|uniref:Uncharacterized protein n=1 Tax=Alligator mississippiensis TaxID=8496 RepID=A0A151N807_ALLMI|nr:hypothetical protein Y1Q_0011278 [Alligator mississippiensis]